MKIAVYNSWLAVLNCDYIDKIIRETEFDGTPSIHGKILAIDKPSYKDIVELSSWQTSCTLI